MALRGGGGEGRHVAAEFCYRERSGERKAVVGKRGDTVAMRRGRKELCGAALEKGSGQRQVRRPGDVLYVGALVLHLSTLGTRDRVASRAAAR